MRSDPLVQRIQKTEQGMKHLTRILLALLLLASCSKLGADFVVSGNDSSPASPQPRINADDLRKALVIYEAAYNSLAGYIKEDVQDLLKGDIPDKSGNFLFLYTHLTKDNNYSIPTSPVLERIYKDYDGKIVRDTLQIYPEGTNSASAEEVESVLSYLGENFKAGKWGLIFGSHASGWIPAGYYANPSAYRSSGSGISFRREAPGPVDIIIEEAQGPAVRSWGQKVYNVLQNKGYEIDLDDLAQAIPFHFDYILFDSCLMGGVEVAYEFRNVCNYMAFSQTEILADGFVYDKIAEHLLSHEETDLVSVCRDYFEHYQSLSGVDQSATISLIDCRELEPLADICREVFKNHRSELNSIKPATVQRYYRYNRHWFYDLGDIISKSGATEKELETFNEALEDCVIYNEATKYFMSEFPISVHSGFSSYLPCNGDSYLNKFYRTLDWNEATGLVE